MPSTREKHLSKYDFYKMSREEIYVNVFAEYKSHFLML